MNSNNLENVRNSYYNLLNDYALTVFQEKELCFQQLQSLRPILFGFTAIVIYDRFALYLLVFRLICADQKERHVP